LNIDNEIALLIYICVTPKNQRLISTKFYVSNAHLLAVKLSNFS